MGAGGVVVGKGRDAAVKALVKKLNSGIGDYVLLFDVKDFFSSITNKTLDGIIPFPHSVREACLFIEKGVSNQTTDSTSYTLPSTNPLPYEGQSDVLPVLSQGSLVSPDVASHVMHDLMKAIPVKNQGSSYVDDGAAVATFGEAQTIKKALISRASALPGGPLSLKSIEIGQPNQYSGPPVDYLGYRLRRGPSGKVRVTPTPVLIANLMNRIAETLKTTPYPNLNKVAYGMATAWRRSQSAWDFKLGAHIFWTQIGILVLMAMQDYKKKLVLDLNGAEDMKTVKS